MAKKDLGPILPLIGPFGYRLDDSRFAELDITLYEGTTKVGRITMASQQVVRVWCADLLRRLGAPVPSPLPAGMTVLVPARIWIAVDTMISPSKRGKGYGRFLYEVGMWMAYHGTTRNYEELRIPPGPFYFLPDECGTSAQTSPEAHRVWQSLRREWPSAYGVVMNPLMFREIEVTALHVDREPTLHPPTSSGSRRGTTRRP